MYFFLMIPPPPISTLFPYTTLFRSLFATSRLRAWARHCSVSGVGSGHEASVSHVRSEEHTSELQSRGHLVCRLLLEKKKMPSQIRHTLVITERNVLPVTSGQPCGPS